VWAIATGQQQSTLALAGLGVIGLAPRKALIAYGNGAGEVHLARLIGVGGWDTVPMIDTTGPDTSTVAAPPANRIVVLTLDRSSGFAVTGSADGTVATWDTATGTHRSHKEHKSAVIALERRVVSSPRQTTIGMCWPGVMEKCSARNCRPNP